MAVSDPHSSTPPEVPADSDRAAPAADPADAGWQTVTPEPSLLGESPFWHPHERLLYWVDIARRQLVRADPSTHQRETWNVPSEPGCIAPVECGGLAIALRDGLYRARTWGGALEPLVRFPQHGSTIRFNDGKCDTAGRFWAGTVYEPRDQRRAVLWCIDMRSGKPEVTLKAQNATTANGVAWSADDRTAWWSDTPAHVIHAWDYEAGPAVLRRHRVFHRFDPKPAGWTPGLPDNGGYRGRPDGASVDSAGIYHCAMFEGGRLQRFAADGTPAGEIALPVACPTMPCFGGEDLRTLFVTTSREKRPAEELTRTPLAGCTLARRVEVPGLPVNFFRIG
ncbi:SMP-30/gluconolactonase/LRE family protein [uncultured Xylophilus sp.]|uniref:SMP-30/gluconolactonase/LRE family protein n=1 Tax=uncultured Xylophilus sp. TaxID=296832 RepID=UPI0025F96FB1|nr:SMP-30/gluconolactonase/LRE family protein [uncultured Xylophilus sp.]